MQEVPGTGSVPVPINETVSFNFIWLKNLVHLHFFSEELSFLWYCTHYDSSKEGRQHHGNIIDCTSNVCTHFLIQVILHVNEFTVTQK